MKNETRGAKPTQAAREVTLRDDENRRTSISRRTILRGAGCALALPWLEAMRAPLLAGEKGSESKAAPVRMAALFVPNGVRQDMWTPDGEGEQFALSPTLAPLARFKQQLSVFSNLWNQASDVGDGHYVKTSGFLTCTTISKSLGIDLNCNGVSMDQVAAKSLRGQTPLPSLELGIDPVSVGVDTNVGYTRVYGSHIAWNGPKSPLAREINPALLFDRLFRVANLNSTTSQRDRMLLDRVLGDAKQLTRKLGSADRQRMDEYLQSVRTIEKRLEQQSNQGEQAWRPRVPIDASMRPPEQRPERHIEHVRLMLDMLALAFQTDTTRVGTFMFGNAVSGRSFSFLDGVSGGHHDTSHHQNDKDKLKAYQIINQWHVEQLSYFLDKLQSMQEGESNVLENSMVLYGSGLRDGNSHSPHNLPIVLAGGGGGKLATGQHRNYSRDTPLANLYVAMLQAFGCDVDQFADSTGTLPHVLA